MTARYLAHCPTCSCTASGGTGAIDITAPYFPLVMLVEREAPDVAAELRARGEYGHAWPGPGSRHAEEATT